jgi:Domain of unknown function (DUF4781)
MSDSWRDDARRKQQDLGTALGDRVWDKFSMPSDEKYLWNRIAIAFSGSVEKHKKEEREKITELKDKCIAYCDKTEQNRGDVYIAFIFVCANKGSTNAIFPLIRVKKDDGTNIKNSYFIDHCGRVYKKWTDFLNENVFDGWWICVPTNAEYTFSDDGSVQIEFYDQTKRGDVLRELDTVSTITGLTTTVTMVAGICMSFFPPTALVGACTVAASSIVGAPAATYGAGRSVGNLIDRGRHDQSINPFASSEARASWLTTAASVLSFSTIGSSAILSSTAKAGKLANSATRVFCTTLNVTALSVNGLGVINGVYEVIKKDEPTPMDILQLTTSLLFFTHSVVSFKTASTIIKDAQKERLAQYRAQVSEEGKGAFDHLHKARQEMYEPGKVREMHGNREFIRDLKQIKNVNDFFKAFQLTPGNQLNVNNELVLDGKAFLQMKEKERGFILEQTKKLREGKINIQEFNRNVEGIRKDYRITFERGRQLALERLNETFGGNVKEFEVNGKKIFENIKPHEIDRMSDVMRNAGKNYDTDRIKVAKVMAEKMGCKNVTEYAAATEYALRQIDNKATELKNNPNIVKPKNMKDKVFFFQEAANEVLNNKAVQDGMIAEFRKLQVRCDAANQGPIRFGNSMAAANHYDKHPHFPQIDPCNPVSPERYFAIATEMCSEPMNNPVWTQDGQSLMCKYVSEKYGALAVRFDNLPNGTSVIATLMKIDGNEFQALTAPRMYSASG